MSQHKNINLPNDSGVPNFIGRQTELNSLNNYVNTQSAGIVVIHGVGGIGKTSLASEFVHQIKTSFDFV